MQKTKVAMTLDEKWNSLTLANNFIFCKVMESEPELCKHLLEILLHIEIDHLEPPQTERTMQEGLDSKSVRFDVYTKDSNRIFDLEMQTVNKENLPKRARYYQSIIDIDNLNVGIDYDELKDTYIIFICLSDIFKQGLPVYSFENICTEDVQTKLNDGTHKVFFNAAKCDKLKSEDEKLFFKYLRGEKASDEFTRKLNEKVALVKKNAFWRKQYMTWEQTIKEERKEAYKEAYNEAYNEAKETTAVEYAKNFLKMNILTSEQISIGTGLPLEKVLALKKEIESMQKA